MDVNETVTVSRELNKNITAGVRDGCEGAEGPGPTRGGGVRDAIPTAFSRYRPRKNRTDFLLFLPVF